MKESTNIARKEIKKLIDTLGSTKEIRNHHFIEIHERTGLNFAELQNASNYYRYRKTGNNF